MKYIQKISLLILTLLTGLNLSAQKTEWIGGTGEWHDPTNWTKGTPTSTDSAIIDQVNADVSIKNDAAALTLVIGDSSMVTNELGFTLTIQNSLDDAIFNDGIIINHGSIRIENAAEDGLVNNNTVLNMGNINVNIAHDAVLNFLTFHNFGTIDIKNIDRDGLGNFGIFNSTDKITIENVTRDGMANFDTFNILAPISIVNSTRDGLTNFGFINQKAQLDISEISRYGIISFEEFISNDDVNISQCQMAGLDLRDKALKIMAGSTWSITQIDDTPLIINMDAILEVEIGATFSASN